jgi:hypothetical protein
MSWYEKLGFSSKGKSKAQFGGGGWYDMVSRSLINIWLGLTPLGLRVEIIRAKSCIRLGG